MFTSEGIYRPDFSKIGFKDQLAFTLSHSIFAELHSDIYGQYLKLRGEIFFDISPSPYFYKGSVLYPRFDMADDLNKKPTRPLPNHLYKKGDKFLELQKKIYPNFVMISKYVGALLSSVMHIKEIPDLMEETLYNYMYNSNSSFKGVIEGTSIKNNIEGKVHSNVYPSMVRNIEASKKAFKERFKMTEQALIQQLFLKQIGV